MFSAIAAVGAMKHGDAGLAIGALFGKKKEKLCLYRKLSKHSMYYGFRNIVDLFPKHKMHCIIHCITHCTMHEIISCIVQCSIQCKI